MTNNINSDPGRRNLADKINDKLEVVFTQELTNLRSKIDGLGQDKTSQIFEDVKFFVSECLKDNTTLKLLKKDLGLTAKSSDEVNKINAMFSKNDIDGLVNWLITHNK